MATFIDRHRITAVDPAVRHQMRLEAEHAIRDPSGTRPLAHWVEDGSMFCVLEAPDEEAVRRHHRDRGVGCDELHQVSDETFTRPLSEDERHAVEAAIKRIWHRDTLN